MKKKKTEIIMTKAVYVGHSILELGKICMSFVMII